MKTWASLYHSKEFYIDTLQASTVVRKCMELVPTGSLVADLGCGNGRNAIYAAEKGFSVDAYDIVDLGWFKSLRFELSQKIRFYKNPMENMLKKNKTYGAILAIRLIQYLNKPQLEKLLSVSSKRLMKNGILAISYSLKGGNRDLGVPRFHHDLEWIKAHLSQNSFEIVELHLENTTTLHTPYKFPMVAAEIIAKKL